MNKGRVLGSGLICTVFAIFSTAILFVTAGVSAVSQSKNIDVNCTITGAISMSASNDIEIDDIAARTFYKQPTTLKVLTNNPYGYTLSMSMSNNDLSGNNALNLAGSSTYQIPSITANVSEGDFKNSVGDNGGWGVTWTTAPDGKYQPLPTITEGVYASKQLKKTSVGTGAAGDTTIVTVGVVPGAAIPAGSYSNILTFSAVVNSAPPALSSPSSSGGTPLMSSAPSRSRSASAPQTESVDEDADPESENPEPRGVLSKSESYIDDNYKNALLATAVASAAAAAFFLTLAFVREDEEKKKKEEALATRKQSV